MKTQNTLTLKCSIWISLHHKPCCGLRIAQVGLSTWGSQLMHQISIQQLHQSLTFFFFFFFKLDQQIHQLEAFQGTGVAE